MKIDNITAEDKKFTLVDVFANQHPVINCWILFNAVAIVALYAITYATL